MESRLCRQWFLPSLVIATGLAVLVGCLEPAPDDVVDTTTAEIVGGDTTDIEMLPWQVSLQGRSGYHFCGGSIVAPTWIVTAAHCVDGGAPSRIMAGSTRLSQSSSGQVVSVKRAIQVPGYSDVSEGKDLALLELDEPLDLNGTTVAAIKPVSPFFAEAGIDQPGEESIVSGWGSLSSGGGSPDSLQSVAVPIVSLSDASSDYGFTLTGDQLPAGLRGVGGRDSCQGDSGGPLVVADGDGYRLAGVVSWGYGCADARYPGIYARVSSFFDFIDQRAGGLPTAVAGDDLDVDGNEEVTLDAGASTDVGVGTIVGVEWAQISGDPVDVTGAGATLAFTAPNKNTELGFQVTVIDDGGNTSTDDVIVTVSAVDIDFPPRPGFTGTDDNNGGSSGGSNGDITGSCQTGGGSGSTALLLLAAFGLIALRRNHGDRLPSDTP